MMASGKEPNMRLSISDSIVNEWQTRAISDVIPRLADIDFTNGAIEVDDALAQEIAADCRWYIDPDAVEATVGERSAYRALLKQIERLAAK
jgi:hypothetical protein